MRQRLGASSSEPVEPLPLAQSPTPEGKFAMKEYTVVLNGVEHTMRLDDEDVKRYKAMDNVQISESSASTKSDTPQNKSRS